MSILKTHNIFQATYGKGYDDVNGTLYTSNTRLVVIVGNYQTFFGFRFSPHRLTFYHASGADFWGQLYSIVARINREYPWATNQMLKVFESIKSEPPTALGFSKMP